jgi:hypothetical protein
LTLCHRRLPSEASRPLLLLLLLLLPFVACKKINRSLTLLENTGTAAKAVYKFHTAQGA